MIICKSKFTLAFKAEGTFKVAVKQLQVVVHAAGIATFALRGQQNLLKSKRMIIHGVSRYTGIYIQYLAKRN